MLEKHVFYIKKPSVICFNYFILASRKLLIINIRASQRFFDIIN